MSLEDSIAALTQIGGQNLTLPQQIAATATQQIARVTDAFAQRALTFFGNFYVNQVTGIDTNPGTTASPLRSIGKAVSLVPRGGVVRIYLQSDYTLTEDITIEGGTVHICSDLGTPRVFSWDRYNATIVNTVVRGARQFRLVYGAKILFTGVNIVVPAADAQWGGVPRSYMSCPIAPVWWPTSGGAQVTISDCTITIPAIPFGALIGLSTSQSPLMLYCNTNLVANGNANGNWLEGYQNPAGTPTTTLPWLLTNLATI